MSALLLATGCYRNIPRHYPGAVSISVSAPKWYGVPLAYRSLAPVGFHRDGFSTYIPKYAALLSRHDPRTVINDIKQLVYDRCIQRSMTHDQASSCTPVLLCWEKPGDFCHRRTVADWLLKELDVDVPEVVYSSPTQSLQPVSTKSKPQHNSVQKSLF